MAMAGSGLGAQADKFKINKPRAICRMQPIIHLFGTIPILTSSISKEQQMKKHLTILVSIISILAACAPAQPAEPPVDDSYPNDSYPNEGLTPAQGAAIA